MSLPVRFRDMISHVIRVFDEDRGLARQILVRMEAELTKEIAQEELTPVEPVIRRKSEPAFQAMTVARILQEGRDGGPGKHEP